MMDKIFDQYHKNRKDPVIKSFKRHQEKTGKAYKDKGDMYPGAKAKGLALHKKLVSDFRAGKVSGDKVFESAMKNGLHYKGDLPL